MWYDDIKNNLEDKECEDVKCLDPGQDTCQCLVHPNTLMKPHSAK